MACDRSGVSRRLTVPVTAKRPVRPTAAPRGPPSASTAVRINGRVRSTQEDPIGVAGGSNLYGYGAGDPVNSADPFGLCPISAGGDGKTEEMADCPRGTSGWWAWRDVQGEGSRAYNHIRGWIVSANEALTPDMPANTVKLEFNLPIGPAGSAVIAGRLRGFTKHGLNQAISRDGVGVAGAAILKAVRDPVRTELQARGAVKYIGIDATVILNELGEVISTWAHNSSAWRIRP